MILDNIVALRILYLLVQPFEKSEAYKLGVIDASGNPLLKIADMNSQQKSNYTMLHRLVFRLKKVLGTLPFGKTNLASIGAAYLLVRESIEQELELDNLEEVFQDILQESQNLFEDTEVDLNDILRSMELLESVAQQMRSFGMMYDDAITTTAGLATKSTPIKKGVNSRKVAIFDVDPETFKKLRKGKERNERWNNFLNMEDETHVNLREYIKKNPNGILVVRCNETKSGQVIRYRKLAK